MAAKGSQAKEIITKKILETFEGAFVSEKEIRIPIMEDGVALQIKVTLTCAKTNIDPNGIDILSTPTPSVETNSRVDFDSLDAKTIAEQTKPTEEEKQNVADLLKALGL